MSLTVSGDRLTGRELSINLVDSSVFSSDQCIHNQPVYSAGSYRPGSMTAGRQAPNSQGTVCGLASDLWARIFSCPEDPNKCLGYQNIEQHDLDEAEHEAFFQLRLVCKAFNQIFADYHPCLTRSLTLRWCLADHHVPSLMSWLHGCTALKRLEMLCQPDCTEIVLAKLSFTVALEVVQILSVRPMSVQLLSAFNGLRMCHLEQTDQDDVLSLAALQSLCSLGSLRLYHGAFSDVPIASFLTALHLEAAIVTAAEGSDCSGLLDLEVCTSTLSGLHIRGLLGCASLQKLTCWDCSISAANVMDRFEVHDEVQSNVPADMPQLKKLHLGVGTPSTGQSPNFDWTYCIKSLCSLTYNFHANAIITQQLSMLSNLAQLDIDNCSGDLTLGDCCVQLAIDWSLVSRLQKLGMRNGTFKFVKQILGLSKLQSLRLLAVENVVCRDSLTVNCLVWLVSSLNKNCPNVEVAMGESEAYPAE